MEQIKRRILLVDDEPSIIKVISKRLETSGFEVIVAMDGAEALAKAESERPDLIILDLMLPAIDGYQVCSHLKREKGSQGIPVVVIFSGVGKEEDGALCQRLGANAYVTKTDGTSVLLGKISALLDEARAA